MSTTGFNSEKLKILFATGSLYEQSSGPFISLLETVKTLHRKGHTPLIVGTKDKWSMSSPIGWDPVPAYAFQKIGPYSLHLTPTLAIWLRRLREPIHMVSLQSVWLYSNYLVSRWCQKRRIPYLISVHGNFNSYALNISECKKIIAKWWFVDEMLANAHCFHALNMAEYEAIRSYGLTQPV